MRTGFLEHYHPGEGELRDLWANAVIAVDANVLLNLYRYSDRLRDDLLSSLEKVRDQLWIPHQVGAEFFRNRPGEMARQVARFDKAVKELDEAKTNLWGLYRAPVKETTDRQKKLDDAFLELESYLKHAQEAVIEPTADPSRDPVLAAVTDLFDGRVGKPYDPDRTKELEQVGDERFANGTPPGYRDADKADSRQYGDLILWFQLIDRAKEAQHPLIFVTDDGKDDWWLTVGRWTLGPRPELIAEMAVESGQRFHMYRPPVFMKQVGQASQESIAEAEALPARPRRDRVIEPALTSNDYLRDLRNRANHQRDVAKRNIIRFTQLRDSASNDRKGSYENQIRFTEQRLKRAEYDLVQIDRMEIQLLRTESPYQATAPQYQPDLEPSTAAEELIRALESSIRQAQERHSSSGAELNAMDSDDPDEEG